MHVGDRSKDTIDAAGIWPALTGVLVRDGYAGYEHLDKIEHAWWAFIWSATSARSTTPELRVSPGLRRW
jgi:transposase